MKRNNYLVYVSLLSFLGTCVAFFFLPDAIPLHWNYAGKVDSWGPRWSIFFLGALPLAAALLLPLLPNIDPRKEAYERHAKTYGVIQLVTVLMLIAMVWVSIAAALNVPIDVGVVIRLVIGIAFIVLGNYMGRLKRNYFVGIKTPWALADDEVWRRTHRRGGWVFVAMGAFLLVSIILPPTPALVLLLALFIVGAVFYMYFYSWLQWRELHGKERPSGGPDGNTGNEDAAERRDDSGDGKE